MDHEIKMIRIVVGAIGTVAKSLEKRQGDKRSKKELRLLKPKHCQNHKIYHGIEKDFCSKILYIFTRDE